MGWIYAWWHRCPNGEVPRQFDRHDLSRQQIDRHTTHRIPPGSMPQCVECGADHVFTLGGALSYGREWDDLQKMIPLMPRTEMDAFVDGILRLEHYALQRWGRRLDQQTDEDIPRELCRLREDLQRSIPGLGTYYDLDAARFMPLSDAVKTFGDVRPFEVPEAVVGGLDRYFMQIAIHEACKSVPEEGRVTPKVGAVIVRNGKVLAAAHRGQLGKGDHAEYTALEKILPDECLTGTTLYATLEPCTTGRSPSKKPCACRIIDRKVSRVLIGMLDPNPDIRGMGERLLRDHGIEVDRFPHDLILVLEELNKDFTGQHSSPK